MRLYPDKEAFLRLAASHNIVPVFADLSVDLETPVSLYYKIVGDAPGFMLESAETSKKFGRYSFIGVEPFLTVVAQADGLQLSGPDKTESIQQEPLAALQSILSQYHCADLPGLPPFSGGAVGYLSFEAVTTWERIRGL